MMLVGNLISKIKSAVLRKGNFKLFCKTTKAHGRIKVQMYSILTPVPDGNEWSA